MLVSIRDTQVLEHLDFLTLASSGSAYLLPLHSTKLRLIVIALDALEKIARAVLDLVEEEPEVCDEIPLA